MKKINTICYFDFWGFDDDKTFHELEVSDYEEKVNTKYFDVVFNQDDLFGVDIAFIDFGGLECKGLSMLVEDNQRSIEKLIIENENILFVFILTMGKEFYNQENILERKNVFTYNRRDYQKMLEEMFSKFGVKL